MVVECKEPKHMKFEDGMSQALGYANVEETQAEFAVYTNGRCSYSPIGSVRRV